MERKITMRKGTIEKKIPVNLISEYMQLGWEEVKQPKFVETTAEKPSAFRLK